MTQSTEETMDDSYLVQRLKKPHGNRLVEAFSFGGGLVNGGLTEEAMGLLRQIFSFDYMGSAEFEFGAVPKALDGLAKAKELVTFSVPVVLADVPGSWPLPKGAPAPVGTSTVYVLCRAEHADEVASRVLSFATSKRHHTKESVNLTSALRPFHEWDREVAGWLELDNGYFFFTDEHMWRQTCALFGVEASA